MKDPIFGTDDVIERQTLPETPTAKLTETGSSRPRLDTVRASVAEVQDQFNAWGSFKDFAVLKVLLALAAHNECLERRLDRVENRILNSDSGEADDTADPA